MKNTTFKPQTSALQRAVQLALLGLATASTPSFAVMLDHGPNDPILTWPQWYRDHQDTAVGLCKSNAISPNAAAGGSPMCFALAPTAGAFAGNVGPEVFYNLIEYRQKPGAATGLNFFYEAALEATYLPGPNPVHGDEAVFTRLRFAINFNNPAWNGTWTVTHPFGVHTFTDVKATNNNNLLGNQSALFQTIDVPGVAMDFNGPLKGDVGPFIQWDVLNPGETLTVNGEEFLGDPNYAHTFTGSPFGTNFIKVEGPAGIDLDGNGNNFLIIEQANVMGQKWTAPIATKLLVEKAVKTRTNPNAPLNAVDVWAVANPAHKLLLTGAGMPSMQMHEDPNLEGHYHGHIEYTGPDVPSSVTVADETSIPMVASSKQLTDEVDITMAQYDSFNKSIDVKAKSSDTVGNPQLSLGGVFGVPSPIGVTPAVDGILNVADCSQAVFQNTVSEPGEVCFHHTLLPNQEPPKFITVTSNNGGSHDDSLVTLSGDTQHISPAPAVTDVSLTATTTGTTTLTDLPVNAWIISQPQNGSLARVNGRYVFTPNPGTQVGTDSFKFVVQDPTSKAVSDVATANLTLTFTASAPIASADQFAARFNAAAPASVLNVLLNDKAATSNPENAIDPASIVLGPLTAARGTVTVNANGTISYKATSAGAGSFTYTVKSVSGLISAPVTVQMTNFAAAEAVTFKKAPSYVNGRWTINPGTSWFGANLGQTTISCYYLPTSTSAILPGNLIGSALVDVTGVTPAAITGSTPVAATGSSVRCTSSNGGTRTAAVVFR